MEQNKRVIALGFFDGVHIGHGALLRHVTERARALDVVPAAFTFDPHPEQVILGQGAILLTTPDERAELMKELYGIRDVIVARFDNNLMHMGWREFVTDLLIRQYNAVHLVVGHDFHFGYRGEGNAERLQTLCAELGVGCDVISPVSLDSILISSTYIRTLVAQGEMERAAQFLGHPYCLTDYVRHGKKLGGHLGFPTVNLHLQPGRLIPACGVYAARVWVDGKSYAAAANVGVRPTVDKNGSLTAEGTLLDFSGDLYGKSIRMEFYRYLRPEQKFDTLEALRAQVMEDIKTVRTYFQDQN